MKQSGKFQSANPLGCGMMVGSILTFPVLTTDGSQQQQLLLECYKILLFWNLGTQVSD